MDAIAELMMSPAWWASTIVAGFLVNIAAAYAKPQIDSLAKRIMPGKKVGSANRNQAIDNYIITAQQSPKALSFLMHHRIIRLIRGCFFTMISLSLALLLAIMYALGPSIPDVVIAVLFFITGWTAINDLREYNALSEIVQIAGVPPALAKRLEWKKRSEAAKAENDPTANEKK
jgi:hypothetical protein